MVSPQTVGSATAPSTSDMTMAPMQDTMNGVVDVESSPPPQRIMESTAVHFAGPTSYTSSGDQLYSKFISSVCGIGEVLGDTVCGESIKCFFVKKECVCGLGGESGCPKGSSVCECYPPTADCGMSTKCFCCKYSIVAPWVEGKPWVVLCKKEIA